MELSIPERTLRRAAAEGLIRGERVSPRRFLVAMAEESYIRTHWALLRSLRGALRTEPNVRLAVLFGSVAAGDDEETSDIDIVVVLRNPDVRSVAAVSERVSEAVGREVQLALLPDAERTPAHLLAVLEEGRVLIDRDSVWRQMQAGVRKLRRAARREERESLSNLDEISLEDRP
jgi:predicted nucleotidyltransferase